jgi:predicted tellurium resistance membrane protein TerC
MLELLTDPNAWLAFLTLAVLEIVLGIDNIIFLSILVGGLPAEQRGSARIFGLALAMLTRIALLFSIVWLTGLTAPWLHIAGLELSGRDLVLAGGGLFLLAKSVSEIHGTLEGAAAHGPGKAAAGYVSVVVQIALIDIVFSLDSVFTAVGMANQIPVMVAAIVVAVLVMMWLSGPIAAFVDRHPTVKMLALSFLILVGVALIGESIKVHVPKTMLYFAMAFSVVVEMINISLRKRLDQRRARLEGRPGTLHD